MDFNVEINRIMNAAIDRAEKPKTMPCNQCNGNGSRYVRGPWNPELDMYDPGEDEVCWQCSGKGFVIAEKDNA